MSTLIKYTANGATEVENAFVSVVDDEAVPQGADIIVSLSRIKAEGEALLASGVRVGVQIEPAEAVEDLAELLPRLALVAVAFPKFRDGRAYTSATLLRQRLGFNGEVRAVGDVLREQAYVMTRCGIDAFVPADGSSAAEWSRAAGHFRHVYQTAADGRTPAYAEPGRR
jgi:uncharacterized protein (DUF934 family)